jgi:hypothetical protein
MNEGNGKAVPEDLPFAGNGPQNLSPQLLQQVVNLTALLAHQRRVRVITEQWKEQLRKLEQEREIEL